MANIKTFALAGNPNCGKTALFNVLTGSTAHVGNWPGVTVDKREGTYKFNNEEINVVDLPGIYSLSPYTPEEVVSRNYILSGEIDGIINVVDATNLERNLYLTTQLLEMDVPVIIALNMMDEVQKQGDVIDVLGLEKELNVPVIPISALKETGIEELMKKVSTLSPKRLGTSVLKEYLGEKLTKATEFFEKQQIVSPLFHGIKLLESDEIEIDHPGAKKELQIINSDGEDLEAKIADSRYRYIVARYASKKTKVKGTTSAKISKADKILTHKIWGIPILIGILFAIFHVTFSENLFFLKGLLPTFESDNAFLDIFYNVQDGAIYSPGIMLMNVIGLITGKLSDVISSLLVALNASEWAMGLVVDGILGGVFAVLEFLPQIVLLFLLFSILEDSGYMARIAFILDKPLRKFGMSGRAFLPMIMGFGCSVPAIANTRTLADEKERMATIRVIPFFSCGAKLPILVAISGGIMTITGVGNADLITFAMYALGILTAFISVYIMRGTTLKGEAPPFIMELPTYRKPKAKSLMLLLWDKVKHFIEKAFTIILASTVIIWFLTNFTWGWQFIDGVKYQIDDSILASIGQFLQPLFTPLGFGLQLNSFGWVFVVAAICGLIAKENVIAILSSLAVILPNVSNGLELEEGVLEVVIMAKATGITWQALIAFIVFNMTTIPCMAAVATARAELGGKGIKNTIIFWLVASFTASCVVYTVLSWVWAVLLWILAFALVFLVIKFKNRSYKKRITN